MDPPLVITNENVSDIFANAIADPTLLSNLDIENLITSLENERNDYLENKTLIGIADEIRNVFATSGIIQSTQDELCNKLYEYRLVDELHELHKGKHVRWYRPDKQLLTNGGIVMDIKFTDNGTQVLCMSSGRRFIQYKFDDCITFQKMSMEEQLIVMAYQHTNGD